MDKVKFSTLLPAILKSIIKKDFYPLLKKFGNYGPVVKLFEQDKRSLYWINSAEMFGECMKLNDTIVKGNYYGIVRKRMPSISYAALDSDHHEIVSHIYGHHINSKKVDKLKDKLLEIIDEELSGLPSDGRSINFDRPIERIIMRFHKYVIFGFSEMLDFSWYYKVVSKMQTHCIIEDMLGEALPARFRDRIINKKIAQNQILREEIELQIGKFIEITKQAQADCFCSGLLQNEELSKVSGYDIIWELFLALGFGTGAAVPEMKFAFDFLGAYPEEARKIAEAQGEDRDHKCLNFMREVYRLRASYFPIFRECNADVVVGGESFEAGDRLAFAPAMLHLKDKFYDNALDFMPDRFQKMTVSDLAHHFYAFGAGPHTCAGKAYITKLSCIILSECLKRFSFQGTKRLKITCPAFLLTPGNKLMMRLYAPNLPLSG